MHLGWTTVNGGVSRAARWGVRITFTSPMDEASVENHIAVSPEPEDDLYFFWEENGRILHAGFPMSPSTPFHIWAGQLVALQAIPPVLSSSWRGGSP